MGVSPLETNKTYLTGREGLKIGTYLVVISLLWLLNYHLYIAESPMIPFTEIIIVFVLGIIYGLILLSFTTRTSKVKKIYLRDLALYLPLLGIPWMIAGYISIIQHKSVFLWFLFFTPGFLEVIGWDIVRLARDLKKRRHNYHTEIR